MGTKKRYRQSRVMTIGASNNKQVASHATVGQEAIGENKVVTTEVVNFSEDVPLAPKEQEEGDT